MKRWFLIILCDTLALSAPLCGIEKTSCEKWQVMDLQFRVKETPPAPLEITFGATLRHNSGQLLDVPGFYNDDRTWVVRFCPSEEGEWNYTTYASLPELSGLTGAVVVLPNSNTGEHGPVSVSAIDRSKFVYRDGTPYFLLAFELDWLFSLDLDNPQDIPKTREIISHISENGFTQVIMNVYAYDASWGDRASIAPEHNFARPGGFPFAGTNQSPDHSRLNIDFFKHLDRVIACLDEKEIIAHLMIYVWNKEVNWPDPGSPEDNRYFDYVVKRYQAYPNLIWDISKEALGYGHNDIGYITERIERLRSLDAHRRLLTVHDYAYCDSEQGKVDFISIQEWKPNIYDAMRQVINTHKNKPVLNIEHGGYEKTMHSIFDGAYNDPVACLDRNYRIVFSGAYSTYYWQNSSWYEVVYNPSDLEPEQRPHFSYYKHLARLFKDYDFNSLYPLQSTFHPFCLTDHATRYLFYLTGDMISISGSLSELKGKTVRIRWFDPLTGIYHLSGSKSFSGEPWLGIRKPAEITSPFCIAILEIIAGS
jgi:hypothetical protein